MLDKIKLTVLIIVLSLTTAVAQNLVADVPSPEVIQVSPYRGDATFTAEFNSLKAHINGLTPPENWKRYDFMNYYLQFMSVTKTKDEPGWCIIYYNPNRQSRSQIDHDLALIRQFIYTDARVIVLKDGLDNAPLWHN